MVRAMHTFTNVFIEGLICAGIVRKSGDIFLIANDFNPPDIPTKIVFVQQFCVWSHKPTEAVSRVVNSKMSLGEHAPDPLL